MIFTVRRCRRERLKKVEADENQRPRENSLSERRERRTAGGERVTEERFSGPRTLPEMDLLRLLGGLAAWHHVIAH
jgi:hypothetical protein